VCFLPPDGLPGRGSSSLISFATSIYPTPGQVKEYLPPYKHPYPLRSAPSGIARPPRSCPEAGAHRFSSRRGARPWEDSMAVIEQAHEEFANIFGRAIRFRGIE